MPVKPVCFIVMASVVLAGCALSFSPPPVSNATMWADDLTVAKAIQRANARKQDYEQRADAVANAPQAFDLPTIAAGMVGLGGAAYNARSDLMKGAAVTATTLLIGRNYYKFSDRHDVLLAGSSTLSCIRDVGEQVASVDSNRPLWIQAVAWAPSGQSAISTTIARVGPIALGASRKLQSGIDDVDTGVRKKLAVPSGPDISGVQAAYKSNYVQLQQTAPQNAQTATDAQMAPKTAMAAQSIADVKALDAQAAKATAKTLHGASDKARMALSELTLKKLSPKAVKARQQAAAAAAAAAEAAAKSTAADQDAVAKQKEAMVAQQMADQAKADAQFASLVADATFVNALSTLDTQLSACRAALN
jgi:hypothetical protein